MTDGGPRIEALTRRLVETPAEFLASPRAGRAGEIETAAVVSDLLRDLGGEGLTAESAAPFISANAAGAARLRLILVASWLLHDPWFCERQRFAKAALCLLERGLDDLVAIVEPEKFVSDPDRREELARVCLAALDLAPEGESQAQAQDRLTTLDSAERLKVMRETRKAQERVRQVQEAMRKKAAAEAAAAYGRE